MAFSPTLRLNGLQRRYYEVFWNGVHQRFSSDNRPTKSPISSVLRPAVWLGNSKKNQREFPDGVQKLLGDELQLIQFGGVPKKQKPIEFEEGSGNVFADLRLKDADQLLTRAHRIPCLYDP